MYPTTARFQAALPEPHRPVSEVLLFRTDGGVETLDHMGGTVSVDRRQDSRRTCSVTLPDPALIPRTAADKLATYGARLRLARGIEFGDGTSELVPLGVFRLDGASGDADEGPVTLTGKSLECVVRDDKFTTPYRASGTAVSAITALIVRSIPDAEVISTATDAAIGPRMFDVESDPWAAVTEIAAAIGAEVYADADGAFMIAELPDLLSAPVAWTVSAGEGGVYVKADRGMTSDGVFNGVLARGENAETGVGPVSSLVVDDDPGSPTYWSGAFGHRPVFYSSAALITTGQCTAAATLKLRSAKAPNASADISSLPNPALEPGDVIRVVYPDGSAELHQIASFSLSLEVGGDFTMRTISVKEDG